MKVQANGVDDFIGTFRDNIRGVLIYGPDSGLVSVRKREILEKVLPDYRKSLSLIELSPSKIKEKPAIINDEFCSMSLFGGDRKVILIEDGENSISKTLEFIFSKPHGGSNFIIITADDLDSKSALRRFAEYNEYFASLPCYKDDANTIAQLVNLKLRKSGFKYTPDVVKYLTESFGGDRLIILNELDKLMVYKGTDMNLTLEDVRACVQDNSETDINDFINNFASLNIDKAFKKLQNLYFDGVFPVAIIRTAALYFLRLQLFKYQLQNGISFDQLAARENIFWKQKPMLQQHLNILSAKNIDDILYFLFEEEAKFKGKNI